jgi:hypothetical protein
MQVVVSIQVLLELLSNTAAVALVTTELLLALQDPALELLIQLLQ